MLMVARDYCYVDVVKIYYSSQHPTTSPSGLANRRMHNYNVVHTILAKSKTYIKYGNLDLKPCKYTTSKYLYITIEQVSIT